MSRAGWVRACSTAELKTLGRKCVGLENRNVTLLVVGKNVHCFDSACHHFGGPLGSEGAIEDFHGRLVVRCPWHNYRVDLATGSGVDVDLDNRVVLKKHKQRKHPVRVADGEVWVRLPTQYELMTVHASDRYNQKRMAARRGASAVAQSMAERRRRRQALIFEKLRQKKHAAVSIDANLKTPTKIPPAHAEGRFSALPFRAAKPRQHLPVTLDAEKKSARMVNPKKLFARASSALSQTKITSFIAAPAGEGAFAMDVDQE